MFLSLCVYDFSFYLTQNTSLRAEKNPVASDQAAFC